MRPLIAVFVLALWVSLVIGAIVESVVLSVLALAFWVILIVAAHYWGMPTVAQFDEWIEELEAEGDTE